MRSPLLPVFVVIGAILLEIFGFAWVGGAVGAFATVVLVVLTAVIGLWVFRLQGTAHWRRIQVMLREGEIPASDLVEGWLLMLGAVLLVVPGFFSDALGFALLIPPVRGAAARWMVGRSGIWSAAGRGRGSVRNGAIEGEYRRSDDTSDRLTDRRDD